MCEKILKYNVHAEREGSLRYAKGRSETMSTLHGLRSVPFASEVKIDLVKSHTRKWNDCFGLYV